MNLPEEAPPITLIDGVPSVTIPIEILRNALWYYDNYFIQERRANSYQSLFNQCTDNYIICTDDLAATERTIARKDRQIRIWRGTTIGVSVVSLITVTVIGVTQ